jgi:murein DD-endopeptidase MepM/ murein hydrolase activator NlpD
MRRPVFRVLVGVLIGVVLVGIGGRAHADPTGDREKELDKEIAQLRDELEGTSAEFAEAAVVLKRSEAELDQVRAELADLREQVAQARQQDEQVTSQLAFARAEEAKAQRELESQRQAQDRARARIGLIARQSYVDSGMTGLAMALRTDDPDQFIDRLAFAGTALQSQVGAVRRLTTQEAELRARSAKVAAIRAEVAELKQRSAELVRVREQAESSAAAVETAQTALVAEHAAALAVVEAKAQEEKDRLERLEAEQRSFRDQLAAEADPADGPGPGASSSSGLVSPVNASITSPFGLRYHPILHIWRMHSGVDYGAGCGTPVYAVASGRVVSAGWAGGYGNRLTISHGRVGGGTLATTYNHLSRFAVRSGTVSRGQVVAYVGTTGLSTGCHLHFETLLNGRYVNPTRYL